MSKVHSIIYYMIETYKGKQNWYKSSIVYMEAEGGKG